MKKKLSLICLFVMAFYCQAHAQDISSHSSDVAGYSGGHDIVRSYDGAYTITYFVTSSFTPAMEVVELASKASYYVDLPPDVYIMDMYFEPGTKTIYFCGSTDYYAYYLGSHRGVGIIGWIDFNEFFTPNVNVNYIYLDDPYYPINSVNKLTEYDNGGVPQIVAIGEHRYRLGNYVYSEQYFVDCFDITGTTILNVELFPTNEHYYDVLRTANYVVLMGSGINAGLSSICYRKTDPYNLSDPMLDDIHFFIGGDDYLSRTHSTAMFDDEIATSYFAVNSNDDFVTRVRMIDINLDLNTNSQEFLIGTKSEPIDIIHIPADNSLVIMQDFDAPGGSNNSNFVYIDPRETNAYITPIEYRPNDYYQSMTMHEWSYYLAAGGGAIWFLKDKTIAPTGSPSPDCPVSEDFKVEPVDNIDHSFISYPFGIPPYSFTFNNQSSPVILSNIDFDCANF